MTIEQIVGPEISAVLPRAGSRAVVAEKLRQVLADRRDRDLRVRSTRKSGL